MSLYNLVHGYNALAPELLKALGTTPADIPRFRDCFLSRGPNEDGEYICIYTRTGGGNREQYEESQGGSFNDDDGAKLPSNNDLRLIDGFVFDADDDFDATYAGFYYKVPDSLKTLVEGLNIPASPGERWQLLFSKMAK